VRCWRDQSSPERSRRSDFSRGVVFLRTQSLLTCARVFATSLRNSSFSSSSLRTPFRNWLISHRLLARTNERSLLLDFLYSCATSFRVSSRTRNAASTSSVRVRTLQSLFVQTRSRRITGQRLPISTFGVVNSCLRATFAA
jgi:hypothetical protein